MAGNKMLSSIWWLFRAGRLALVHLILWIASILAPRKNSLADSPSVCSKSLLVI